MQGSSQAEMEHPFFLLDWTPITLIGTAGRVGEWVGVLNGATTSLHLVQEQWQISTVHVGLLEAK